MVKIVKRGAACFLVGLLTMQVIFNGASKVGAAHSETGTYTSKNNVSIILEAGTNKESVCYCIEPTVSCGFDETARSNKVLDPDMALLLNAAVMYGYGGTYTSSPAISYNETQSVVWQIVKGDITLSSLESLHSNYSLSNRSNALLKKLINFAKNPSFVNENTNTLTWNASTNKFELTLTNSTAGANEDLAVDTTTLPAGVEAVVEGENLKLTSTEEFTDVREIKLYKVPAEKGLLVAWDIGSYQDQISIDTDERPLARVMSLKINTETKPVVATPAPTETPVATETPAQAPVEQPQQVPVEEPVQENQPVVIEDKEVTTEALDDVPATADSTDFTLVFMLMGASLFTWVALICIKKIEEKHYTK